MRRFARRAPLGEAAAAYAAAALSPGSTPWRDASYCVVDLETTGLDPRRHEIVSFAAVTVQHGRVRLGGALHRLVRPAGPLPSESVRVHGLRAADLRDAPALDEALDELLEAMAGRFLVAHAAWVERGFLGPALGLHGVRLRGRTIDTSVLGRLWLGERDGALPRRLSLRRLVAELGLPAHHPHTALGDALTTAQAFVAVSSHLDAIRRETVRSLMRASDRVQTLEMYRT